MNTAAQCGKPLLTLWGCLPTFHHGIPVLAQEHELQKLRKTDVQIRQPLERQFAQIVVEIKNAARIFADKPFVSLSRLADNPKMLRCFGVFAC